MVTYNDVKLRDTANQVNGGTEVSLNCTGIKYTWKNFTQKPQYPGKSPTGGAHNTLLAKGDSTGFKNPTYKVTGIIDVSGTADNIISLKLLQQFAKSGNILELKDEYDSDRGIYRTHGLDGTFPNETGTVPYVMVDTFTLDTDNQTNEGTKMGFIISFDEVQQ